MPGAPSVVEPHALTNPHSMRMPGAIEAEPSLLVAPRELRETMWARLAAVIRKGSDRDAIHASKVVAEFDRLELVRAQLQSQHGVTVDVQPLDYGDMTAIQQLAARMLLGPDVPPSKK